MNMDTAVIIVAPHPVQAIAVPLLQRYSPDTLVRILAHITILYPFVKFEQLEYAYRKLHTICGPIAPFDITMRGYDSFPGVLFMNPANPEPIKAVFRQVFAAFPECPPYEGKFGTDLHPHMTVGEFSSQAEQEAAVLPDYAPVTFQAAKLHLMYGPQEFTLPWITYGVIPFGG